jgi:hypothetical protein
MSRGVLIFAHNNEKIDYEKLAKWSAKNIERHLGLPTHIETSNTRDDSGKRNFADVGLVQWHNTTRTDAYSISPWDETIVLDADYVVASNQLGTLFESPFDFMCHRWAYDITGINDFKGLNYFGTYRMPMWWATVMMFRRSRKAELIFEAMTMIRNNWAHYRNLYGDIKSVYRNDHALSIALNIENGHTMKTTDIPWNLASLTADHKVSELETDHYRVDFVTPTKQPKWLSVKNQDFHVMGKRCLEEIIGNHS